MPFIKINDYHINVDHIFYIRETGNEYVICFGAGDSAPIYTNVPKPSPAAHRLIQALSQITKVIEA